VRLVLLGPPGAGKGTQAARLAERYRIDHISTGDLLRWNVGEGTDLGREARAYMDRGELVPDDLVMRMLMERLDETGSGFVLDGFPRNVAQAEDLDEALHERGLDLDAVLSFDVDPEVVVRRLAARRTCPVCQRTYNMLTAAPRSDEVCDEDGSPLAQREDDRPEVVRRRLQVFEEQTAPVRDHYERLELMHPVGAEGSEDEVFARAVAALPDLAGEGRDQ
jgi:adenylate kinase